MIEKIVSENVMLALIVRAGFDQEGIHFFTPEHYSQQLGYMRRPAGYVVKPHLHKPILREVSYTKEVLFIKKGIVRIDFYGNDKNYLESKILHNGDVILLAYGGHGIEVLEETIMIEVKQGPYAGVDDKVRFDPVDKSKIVLAESELNQSDQVHSTGTTESTSNFRGD